jgi:hypothetical protein
MKAWQWQRNERRWGIRYQTNSFPLDLYELLTLRLSIKKNKVVSNQPVSLSWFQPCEEEDTNVMPTRFCPQNRVETLSRRNESQFLPHSHICQIVPDDWNQKKQNENRTSRLQKETLVASIAENKEAAIWRQWTHHGSDLRVAVNQSEERPPGCISTRDVLLLVGSYYQQQHLLMTSSWMSSGSTICAQFEIYCKVLYNYSKDAWDSTQLCNRFSMQTKPFSYCYYIPVIDILH